MNLNEIREAIDFLRDNGYKHDYESAKLYLESDGLLMIKDIKDDYYCEGDFLFKQEDGIWLCNSGVTDGILSGWMLLEDDTPAAKRAKKSFKRLELKQKLNRLREQTER